MPYGRGYRRYGGYRNGGYSRGKRQYAGGVSRRNGGGNGYKRRYSGKNISYGDVFSKVADDASKALAIGTKLMGLINTEFKSIDIATTGVISSTPTITLLNGLAVGDDFDERDGRQVRFKSIQISIGSTMHATPLDTEIRIWIVIDKQPNETTMVFADYMDNPNSTSFRNLDQRKRFVTLYDEVQLLSVGRGTTMLNNWYSKLDMITVYDASVVGDITDITTNALYLILFSNQASNTPSVARTIRVRFIDN